MPAATVPQASQVIGAKIVKTGKKPGIIQAKTKDTPRPGAPQPNAAPIALPALATTLTGQISLAGVASAAVPATQAADATLPVADRSALPAHAGIAAENSKQSAFAELRTSLAETAQSSQNNPAPMLAGNSQTTAPTNAITTGIPPSHPALSHVSSHAGLSDTLSQVSDALPAGTAKAGAGLALHVSLTPETLGKIVIKIDHGSTGDANVTITASQPQTLETLKKDISGLNQILTNAGLPEAGRQIEFRAGPVPAAQVSAGLGNANSAMQGNTGGQQAPQHGTGFAGSPAGTAFGNTAASALPLQPALRPAASSRGVDMIA